MLDQDKVKEIEVINEGLITKALYINEGIESNTDTSDENKLLLEVGDKKRKQIVDEYKKINKKIRPLVIIQFPDASEQLIEDIEEMLNDMGYSYKNKMVGIWMDERHENLEDIKDNDSQVAFLLMKQAIATGWNCPRAKILIKLRKNMSESFEIQTIGRIRRMPESQQYDNEILDNCFLYTFDEAFKQSVRREIESAYDVKTIVLKEKCKDFTLLKQNKDKDIEEIDARSAYRIILKYLNKKYNFTVNFTVKCV